MLERDRSKQATTPGGDEGSEENQGRVKGQANGNATLDGW